MLGMARFEFSGHRRVVAPFPAPVLCLAESRRDIAMPNSPQRLPFTTPKRPFFIGPENAIALRELYGPGRWVVLAGQTGGDEKGDYQPDMAGQVAVALRQIIKLLGEAGAGPQHIVRLTWYLT